MTTPEPECDHDEDPMADGPATGPFARGLWRDVRWWLHHALNVFGAFEELTTTGLNRALGRRLAIWLYTIECTVRRLILAAAFALGVAPIAARASAPRVSTTATTRTRRARFIVFARHIANVAGRAPRAIIASTHGNPSHRHATLTRDPLLTLGAPQVIRRQRNPSAPRGPLVARQKPLSRYDPRRVFRSDWESELERRTRLALARPRTNRLRRKLTSEERADMYAAGEQLHAWKVQEAARDIPATNLAHKLQALARLMLDPTRIITRTARRLARERTHNVRVETAGKPALRHRRADRIRVPDQAMLDEACALWPPPAHDSS